MSDGGDLVQLEKTYPPSKGSPEEEWQEVTKTLPDSDCRYVAYDFVYEYQGANKNKVLFLLWAPDTSKILAKMLYASSQEGVVNKMEGVQRQLQCTEKDEVQFSEIRKALAAHTAGY